MMSEYFLSNARAFEGDELRVTQDRVRPEWKEASCWYSNWSKSVLIFHMGILLSRTDFTSCCWQSIHSTEFKVIMEFWSFLSLLLLSAFAEILWAITRLIHELGFCSPRFTSLSTYELFYGYFWDFVTCLCGNLISGARWPLKCRTEL